MAFSAAECTASGPFEASGSGDWLLNDRAMSPGGRSRSRCSGRGVSDPLCITAHNRALGLVLLFAALGGGFLICRRLLVVGADEVDARLQGLLEKIWAATLRTL